MPHSLLNFSSPLSDQNCRGLGPFVPGDPREGRIGLLLGDKGSDLRNVFILLISPSHLNI